MGIGIKFNYNHLKYFEKLLSVSANESVNGFGTELGLIYKINHSENEKIKFGLSYSTEISFSKNFTISGQNSLLVNTSGNSTYYLVSSTMQLNGNIPSHLIFDFSVKTIPHIEILGSIEDVFWGGISSGLKDQLNFSGSMIYKLNDVFSPSLGFYSTGYHLKSDFYGLNDEMNAFYITSGLQINLSLLNFDLAFAESHLLSGEDRKQTIIKAGVKINL